MTRRSWLVYGTLLAIWVVLIGWQAAEHVQVRHAARTELRHRAETISKTLALIVRTTARGPFASKERIEAWLNELVKEGEVYSIKLFNVEGEDLASAGAPIELPKDELPNGEYWDKNAATVTLMNLVDLGTNIIQPFPTNRFNRPPDGTNFPAGNTVSTTPQLTNSPIASNLSLVAVATNSTNGLTGTNGLEETNGPRRNFTRRGPRYTEEEIAVLRAKKSAHGFIMVMSAQSMFATVGRDMWLRAFIILLATLSVVGSALAWRNVIKTSELQIRLVRASELNSHLNQMNLAAAGLAHETRNPLNIVRGLAQMISKQQDASPEIRIKSREIIDETDRVAAQLNEFINYSRPREVRRAATRVNSVVAEVARALNYDLDEKKVSFVNQTEDLVVEADEQLLRQALFNLAINAIQAVPANGEIVIRASRQGNGEVYLEVSDNGRGVTPENRTEIFKPYFTTNEEGRGLGLAVVRQIVLAHGWEIECVPNSPAGATFRITHLKLAARS